MSDDLEGMATFVAVAETKGVLQRNTASRKISRLSHRVRGMGAGA